MWTCGRFASILLLLAPSPAIDVSQPLGSVSVTFPETGSVRIQGAVKQGDFPRLVFRSKRTGKLLLNVQVGEGDNWREFIGGAAPHDLDMEIRFIVLHRASLPDPLILALAKRQGGSDCGFNSALVGEVDGRLSELTPPLPDHWLRGGLFLSMAANSDPTELAVTSERYQANDVHYVGPSRMAIYVYTFDPSQGRFIETRHSEVNSDDLKVSGEDLIRLFGKFAQC